MHLLLQCCREEKQQAILFCHLGLKPNTCPNACLAWNYEDALTIIHDFKDICVATFSGHAHSVRPPISLQEVLHITVNLLYTTEERATTM